jgi:hypothetical protein
VADVRLPLAQQQIQRNYDIVTGLELPIEQNLAARETNRIAQFNPAIAGQQFQSGVGTSQMISQLKMQTAGMSYENASRYLQSLGVPPQMWSAIIGGQAGNLGQIAGLQEGSRYLGLQDVLGSPVVQPQYFSNANPGYPPANRYTPGAPAGAPALNPLNAPGAPATIGGNSALDPVAQYYAQTGQYPATDPNYSAAAMANIEQGNRYASVYGG